MLTPLLYFHLNIVGFAKDPVQWGTMALGEGNPSKTGRGALGDGYGAAGDVVRGETEAKSRQGGRLAIVGGAALVVMCACILGVALKPQQTTLELEENAGMSLPPPVDHLTAADKEYCETFQGWLKEKCLEARRKDATAPQFWDDDQVGITVLALSMLLCNLGSSMCGQAVVSRNFKN